jgi:two-component system, response regulator PdtaR
MHALIIEDEPIIASLIKDHLTEIGFDTFDIAATQSAAVHLAKQNQPAVIVADVTLTEGNGIDAIQQICSERIVPVVFVTASAAAVLKAMPTAVVVTKPLEPSALAAGYLRALQRWHLRPPL